MINLKTGNKTVDTAVKMASPIAEAFIRKHQKEIWMVLEDRELMGEIRTVVFHIVRKVCPDASDMEIKSLYVEAISKAKSYLSTL